jgi:hypothetical protein
MMFESSGQSVESKKELVTSSYERKGKSMA